MDILARKSDGAIIDQWGGTVDKVTLPEQTGGDVTFVGDKRPVDLSNYLLIAATVIDEPLDPETQKRGPTTTEVDVQAETVVVTHTTIEMTVEDRAKAHNAPIQAKLDAIDVKSIRSMRAKQTARGKPEDDTKLNALQDEAEALRAQLQ